MAATRDVRACGSGRTVHRPGTVIRMRPVVSLLSRSILATIRDSLKETGQARCDLVELRVDVDEWRALARKAARELGRSVQTIETQDQVAAVLRDWPRTDEERAVTLARMRKTMRAMEGHAGPED
ncbi:hypothetical protein SD72_16175 [Leucobacter komagatae]|uniref:Uncharacterized protein n=2 Tax=Leucobacter komagatae TaxID=55969 RepID=A0A0D0II01_9MICO|nr:hypothetical protein SD72_16175 [Leucobacter komagatae]